MSTADQPQPCTGADQALLNPSLWRFTSPGEGIWHRVKTSVGTTAVPDFKSQLGSDPGPTLACLCYPHPAHQLRSLLPLPLTEHSHVSSGSNKPQEGVSVLCRTAQPWELTAGRESQKLGRPSGHWTLEAREDQRG